MTATNLIKRCVTVGSILSALNLAGCVVSRSDYDALQQQNSQLQQQTQTLQQHTQTLQQQTQTLQQQVTAQSDQISRLQGAIKYTVNSDLLFPSGGWQMSARGQQLIAPIAAKLAPFQQNKIYVNGYTDNVPISPALQQQGITSNQVLSEKRAENVRDYLISQGVKADLVSAQGFGEQDPVALNDTSAGRAKNRRVELTLSPPSS
jgi:chemotaxis protein MotB